MGATHPWVEDLRRLSPAVWSSRWLALRDRWLADERFRRWAAAFPLTRQVARRRAAALFDLAAGFVYSQVLLACVELQVFDRLSGGPLSLAELARRMDLDAAAARRLLDAATALRLLERRSADSYGLAQLGAALVGNAAIAAMVEHHSALYADLADPVQLLRGIRAGALGCLWPYARSPVPADLDAQQVAQYSALMAASQSLVADEVLDAHDFRGHRLLLEVGGGEGAFIERAAQRAPQLRFALFDLPAVAQRARTRLARGPAGARTDVVGGDFLVDPLPQGADLATLIRVVHDHDDDAALALLRRVREALAPGGTLLLAEPMSDTPGARAMGDAYFGIYLFAMGQGRPRSRRELARLLHQAGYEAIRPLATRLPLQTGLLRARAP